MGSEKIPGRTRSCDQEQLVEPVTQAQVPWMQTTYKPEYDHIAFEVLSGSDEAKTKAHLCMAFHCSKPTLLNWMKKFPSFKAAVESGLKIGEAKFRNKIAQHAFKPTAKVNNGLIKLLASNVYGIKEEVDPAVVVNNNVETDPEQMMKNRGIPVPKVGIEDVE